MKILVGLGNPGTDYTFTRHNAGFIVLDAFVRAQHMPDFSYKKKLFAEITQNNSFLAIKPQTFMNESGRAVRAALDFYKDKIEQPLEESLIIIHDDLDIAFGEYKLQQGKKPKVHNGVTSVNAYSKHENCWYLRIGIDGRGGDRSIPGHAYVLQNFSLEERQKLALVTEQEIIPDILARFGA